MRLSEYTDYTLRVLMTCAMRADRRVTIAELAREHGLSKNHLMKVVNDLARRGLLQTTRGRGGGLRLLADPAQVRIGDVVRATETDFRLVECFDPERNRCALTPRCQLRVLFTDALAAYLKVLDGATLADVSAALSGWQGLAMPAPAPVAAGPLAPPRPQPASTAPIRLVRRVARRLVRPLPADGS